MRAPLAALLIGLALIATAVGLVLTGSPAVLARANATVAGTTLAAFTPPGGTSQKVSVCQGNEEIPRDTTAIRLSLEALLGPRLTVTVLTGGRAITSGSTAAGWTNRVLTVPVRRVASTTPNARVCFKFVLRDETVTINGAATPRSAAATSDLGALPGRMRVEYLRPGDRSWWSRAGSIAQRIGLGRAWSGSWLAPVLILLMLGLVALVSWQATHDLR